MKKTRRAYRLRTRRERLHERGFLTLAELSTLLGISAYVIKARRLQGTLCVRSVPLDDTGAHMYENPATVDPTHDLYRRGAV